MRRITAATSNDLPEVTALLEANGLPVDGIPDLVGGLLVAHDGDTLLGTAGLEWYEDGALLRSVAVDARARGTGLGQELTLAALETARSGGAHAVFLLTTTAEAFFPRFGFERVSRDDVPASVKQSVEFTSACPASAIVMRKRLASRQ